MKRLYSILLIFGSALSVWSCNDLDNSPKALVNVLLIDAPAVWDSVIVEIQGVELEIVPNGREGEIQKIFLPYEPADKQIDISQLVGGTALPVAREELGLGVITGISLKLGTGNNLYIGENQFPLTLPGGKTDYFQPVKIDLESGFSYDLILDFDLEKSIRVRQSTPLSFGFNPSISAYSGIGKGELIGTLSPRELQPAIFAIANSDSVSTHTDGGGRFLFRLKSGKYTVFIDPKDSRYRSDTLLNVEVKAGIKTTLESIILSRK